MGFKTDTSFLRFLTMGALGVHQTIRQLSDMGFYPIELERYCGSNKIWMTKVKRLRLPDLLCVRTGVRIEVRAKSDLAIKMSDAPGNPEREWDSGLQNDDLAAFIACFDDGSGPVPADEAMFFRIEELRASVEMSRLGAPKSASEGAERDREWPTTVPKRDGQVLEINENNIVTQLTETDEQDSRRQTYQLRGKHPYVTVGQIFNAGSCFLSGAPSRMADLNIYLQNVYDPFAALQSENAVDRYAAVKSLPHREDETEQVITSLEQFIDIEQEMRVRLEAAGSAVFFGSALGQEILYNYIWDENNQHELRMETVLILIELCRDDFTRDLLTSIAGHEMFREDEIRQAAIWGLGKAGLQSYEDLLPYIDDDEDNVALHAIVAFGDNTPNNIIDSLITRLMSTRRRSSSAASEALRIIGTPYTVNALVTAYNENQEFQDWILATLGRMPPDTVMSQIHDAQLVNILKPMFLNAPGSTWLSSEQAQSDISFLSKQAI